MKCPKCALINPDSALRCDCGYKFKPPLTEPNEGSTSLKIIIEKNIKYEKKKVQTILKWVGITIFFIALTSLGTYIIKIGIYGWHIVIGVVIIGMAVSGFIGLLNKTRPAEAKIGMVAGCVTILSVAVILIAAGYNWEVIGALIILIGLIWLKFQEKGTLNH